MTFATEVQNSVNKLRTLVELDITNADVQWVNYGAGIWGSAVNLNYANVDPSLYAGFESLSFNQIGSLEVDQVQQTQVFTFANLTSTLESFLWDSINSIVYIHLINNDDPHLHFIVLGGIFGYSFDGFRPIGSLTTYEGRLLNTPKVQIKRDPLFFGKLAYQISDIQLNNSDGFFDSFESFNSYGNELRIYLGFSDVDISEYKQVASGYIGRTSFNEDTFTVSLIDKRRILTKEIQYVCTNKNALDAIVELLQIAYPNILYTSDFFDLTQWARMQAIVPNVTIRLDQADTGSNTMPVSDIIQDICASVFGVFLVTEEGKYSFNIASVDNNALAFVPSEDILNALQFESDPEEIVSSTKVGYSKDWHPNYISPYTFLTDTSREAAVFQQYGVYVQKTFFSLLTNLTDAQSLSDTILDYITEIHAEVNIVVPLSYYLAGIADMLFVEFKRKGGQDIFGVKKCEIVGKSYDLRTGLITFNLRKYNINAYIRVTDSEAYRRTTGGVRIVEVR